VSGARRIDPLKARASRARSQALSFPQPRYEAFDKVELAIGADNVFDVYPDRSPFGPRPTSIGGIYPANQDTSRSQSSLRSDSMAGTYTAAWL